MAQGKTISQLTGATTVNQQDLFLIYQTGSTLNVSVSALTQNIVNTNFTGGTMTVTGLTTSSSISATTYLNLPYGNGTLNYIPKWTGSTGLSDSTILDNGSTVWVGYNNLLTSFRVSANTFNIGKGGSTNSRGLFMGKSITGPWVGSGVSGQFDFNNPIGDQGIVIKTNAGYVGTGGTPVAGGIISVQGGAHGLILAGNPIEENHFVIDEYGKIGIGTYIPESKLDVIVTANTVGVRISGNSSSDMLRVTQTGLGNAIVVEDSNSPDSTPFVVKNDGKVYLGTYTEETTSLLNIGGNAHLFGNLFINGTSNRVIRNAVDGRALINFASVGDSYLNNGKFGIGTSVPQVKLHISSSPFGGNISNTDIAVFENSGYTNVSILSSDQQNASLQFGSTSDVLGAYIRWNHDNNEMSIGTANNGDNIRFVTGNEETSMFLRNGYGLGIGTTSPTERLHVSGNTLIDGDIIYPKPSNPPTNSNDNGVKGTITWDNNYFYICVNTNTWKRTQISSW